jgi:CheY-like chemotaxis protein
VKFTEQGVIYVLVNLLAQHEEFLEIEFIVKDTGIGITPQQVEHLFKPFSQLDSSMTRKYGGTGLGLAICKTLVELMKGTIRTEQHAEAGATFVFTIRAKPFYHTDGEHSYTDQMASEILSPIETDSLSIIVAEDHDINQKLLLRILQKLGHSVHIAENGQQVLDLLKHTRFDLILMDLQMPVMDGFQTTEAIMKNIQNGEIPKIIAVTASAAQTDIDQCTALGMVDFIKKPFKMRSIQQVLEQHFSVSEQ